jgi:DNA-binding MarR family transcriptional regulator
VINDKLTILQLVRLRGRITLDDLAAAAGLEQSAAAAVVAQAQDAGWVSEARDRVRITAEGREVLADLTAEERASVDRDRLSAAYERFDAVNTDFKQLVTDWQLIDGETPNDHSDAAYDAAVVERLGALHERFAPLLAELAGIAPRLAIYPPRFGAALEKVQAGEHSWLARPLIDSYHTAWFELHEDLIGLAGLTRKQEAAAGRAQ